MVSQFDVVLHVAVALYLFTGGRLGAFGGGAPQPELTPRASDFVSCRQAVVSVPSAGSWIHGGFLDPPKPVVFMNATGHGVDERALGGADPYIRARLPNHHPIDT